MLHYLDKVFYKINKRICYLRGWIRFGKKVYIEKNVTIHGISNIKIGKKCKIFQGTILNATNGKIIFFDNVTICVNSIINSAGGIISIDSGTTVGDLCNLYGQGSLKIGKDVMIASCVQIVPNQHEYKDISVAIKFQPEKSKGITINDGCWIGTNVVILDNIKIGKNSVIGAGSVVNKNIPDYSVAAGVPCQIVKQYNLIEKCWNTPLSQ